MDKKEIKDYLKRADELGAKLVGEDKETYTWLIYGYNQCAKLLNEKEQQCKKQKEVINKAIELLNNPWSFESGNKEVDEITYNKKRKVIDILKEVSK